eukprot:11411092-Alexandrium_andersonii.AAC.1
MSALTTLLSAGAYGGSAPTLRGLSPSTGGRCATATSGPVLLKLSKPGVAAPFAALKFLVMLRSCKLTPA